MRSTTSAPTPGANDVSEELLGELCEWLNGPDFTAPTEDWRVPYEIIKAALAHLYLAWVHPFGDGNGRTARLLEFRILLAAGVPSPATHLLSNHYNQTRSEYYRQLARTSESGGDVMPFIVYAVQGFLDGLREQLKTIRQQQFDDRWEQFVYETFGEARSPAARRQRQLVLDLSKPGIRDEPVPRPKLRTLSPALAEAYAGKTAKTLSRDINELVRMHLIERSKGGFRARRDRVLAFLPLSAAEGVDVV